MCGGWAGTRQTREAHVPGFREGDTGVAGAHRDIEPTFPGAELGPREQEI